jgi:subtilisin family serine protease
MDYTRMSPDDPTPAESEVLRTPEGSENETTGRFLVLLQEGAPDAEELLSRTADLQVAHSADFAERPADMTTLQDSEALVFDELGVAVVDVDPAQVMALGAAAADDQTPILAVEPERVVYAIPNGASDAGGMDAAYVRGYRDAVANLSEALLGQGQVQARGQGATVAQGTHTWGLRATNVVNSPYTGKGVRVAVLDTGLADSHPDLAGRDVTTQSFIPGEAVNDLHGHGTHCIGTACGPREASSVPGYGVASQSSIYAAKVLSNAGRGTDSQILGGIQWAVRNRCAVASMSLGARVMPGQSYSSVFEAAARRAAALGTLIVAAAGNDSRRHLGVVVPVSHPANCPSILAVGALDDQLQVAYFSNGGMERQGGQLDMAAPGVGVLSAWKAPQLHHTISGTSMATPHVAGIAALFAEANPDMRGAILAWLLFGAARRLDLSSRDVGAGLVQAP